MANLLSAADQAQGSSDKLAQTAALDDQDDFLRRLREEVVDRFSNEFSKLYAELDTLKKTTLSEEEEVMRTLDDVRSREDDKLHEQRELLRNYEQ